jgi:hypothetical protein
MENKNQKGQALIELIIFLPFMFIIYGLITGFANAIFGSINQQKATRAYFYYRVQNNSTIPRRPDSSVRWTKYGTYFVGWREKLVDDVPLHPCYKITIPLSSPDDDGCDSEYTGGDRPSTQFMRVGTVYGFCGATYIRQNNLIFHVPHRADQSYLELLERDSCTISE